MEDKILKNIKSKNQANTMLILIPLFQLLKAAEVIEENDNNNVEPNEDSEISDADDDSELPKPIFLKHYERISVASITFAISLGIVLVCMQFPLPIFHGLKKAATIGLGVFLATAHLSYSFISRVRFAWILAYIASGVSVFFSFNSKISPILLSFVGSYVFSYLALLLLSHSYSFFFYIMFTKLFVGFIILALFFRNLQYIIIKSGVATMVLALIINLMTPLKVLAVFHGNGFRFLVSVQENFSKLIILVSFIIFFFINLLYDNSVPQDKDEKKEKN